MHLAKMEFADFIGVDGKGRVGILNKVSPLLKGSKFVASLC